VAPDAGESVSHDESLAAVHEKLPEPPFWMVNVCDGGFGPPLAPLNVKETGEIAREAGGGVWERFTVIV